MIRNCKTRKNKILISNYKEIKLRLIELFVLIIWFQKQNYSYRRENNMEWKNKQHEIKFIQAFLPFNPYSNKKNMNILSNCNLKVIVTKKNEFKNSNIDTNYYNKYFIFKNKKF